jgi:acetyl esterase/lipase
MARQYLDGHDPTDPAASPALAAPADVAAAWPPLLVQVGSHEVLLDDALAVTRTAALADVPVTLDVWPQMQHFFQLGVGVYPEAAAALARAGTWWRQQS